jgi:hypothetical protein
MAAPRIGLVVETFDAWNPPIIDCNTPVRELKYSFKVTSALSALKNADSKNITIEIDVDRTPDKTV